MSTFANEGLLPRVPLPTLDATRSRFLQWCAPLLTPEQLAETRAAVDAFVAGPGPALHAALAGFDTRDDTDSWLDEFWPSRYLGRRDRIALNANFFFLFEKSDLGRYDRAATLVDNAVRYKLALDAERIPAAEQRGAPQSMRQHRYLFSATRIPGARQDTARVPYSATEPGPSTARHIAVLHRGHVVRLDVLDVDGRPYPIAALASTLADIVAAHPEPTDAPVGHLTTLARAEWATRRAELVATDPGNAVALDEIETALFLLCLDDNPADDDQQACAQLLAGDSANRWFDKALSFVVLPDGTAGVNVEHCLLDGTTILALVDAILGAQDHSHDPDPADGTPAVSALPFVLSDDLRTAAHDAGEAFATFAADTATDVLTITEMSSTRAKSLRMSPDALVQLAFQLAHRRAKGLTGATYESIATRGFRNGRTEAMRVVTPEMVTFVDAMTDSAADAHTRLTALRAAADAHVARAKQCQAGDAPEQHLWELQLIAARRGDPEPELFTSPGWRILRDDYLSTSSAPSTHIRYFGFGSTSPTCIGVAYVLLPDRLTVHLSSPRAVVDGLDRFAAELRVALADLVTLLEAE